MAHLTALGVQGPVAVAVSTVAALLSSLYNHRVADYWGWGWGDPNGHLRVSGRRLLEWADRLGWSLYAEERSTLERAAEVEIYLDQPLDELDVVTFGAAVDKLRGRARKSSSPFENPSFRLEAVKDDPVVGPDDPPRKQKKPKRPKNRGRDDQRGRRWR